MKHNCLLLLLFFSLGLEPVFSQTISSQKGLTTAVFNLPAGAIKVYLPDDIRPGETISGTVSAEPSGKNAKQLEKNLTELKKYTVSFNGQNFSVVNANSHFSSVINSNTTASRQLQLMMDIKTIEGKVVEVHILNNSPKDVPAICAIPAHALTSSPFRITGPFDGNADNTRCSLDNRPLEILAESPRQCIVQYPNNITGIQNIQVTENGQQKCSKPVSSVNMDISTGKLNLIKGEKTFLKVQITGLRGLPDQAKLSLQNLTTDIVTMLPSNSFTVLLSPDSVRSNMYEKSFNIQSIRNGNFSVNVDLDLPEAGANASVRTGAEPPVVFADNKGVDAGGIKLHPLKVDGLKNGMSDAFKKAVTEVTGNRGNKYPEVDGCGSCLTCIQSMLDEGKVALVGEIGKILMEHYVDLLVGKAGGALAWIKDKFDKLEKAEDIAGAIADAVTKGEIQIVEFPEKMCGYCLVSAIGFYDAKTQCMDAFFYCKGSKMCCTHSLTIIHLKYCVNDDGFKKPDAGLEIDVISR